MSGGAAWSRRLWSLWELMEKFPAEMLCETVSEIERLIVAASKEQSDSFASQEFAASVNQVHQKASFVAARGYLKQTLKLVKALVERHQQFEVSYGRAAHELESLLRLMKSELDDCAVLALSPGHGLYYDKERLLGNAVYEAFPSARLDIKAAGNCFATENATACIFHLMRASEIVLRILAWDRRVTPKSDRPLDLAQWGDILQGLGTAVERIQGFPATHARESQYAFYHGAMMELRSFQHLYRDRTAHSREHYDLYQARSAMEHVTRFMQILAGRISEGKEQTPEIWTDNWLKEQDAKRVGQDISY